MLETWKHVLTKKQQTRLREGWPPEPGYMWHTRHPEVRGVTRVVLLSMVSFTFELFPRASSSTAVLSLSVPTPTSPFATGGPLWHALA